MRTHLRGVEPLFGFRTRHASHDRLREVGRIDRAAVTIRVGRRNRLELINSSREKPTRSGVGGIAPSA
jgi:hypothetical protein